MVVMSIRALYFLNLEKIIPVYSFSIIGTQFYLWYKVWKLSKFDSIAEVFQALIYSIVYKYAHRASQIWTWMAKSQINRPN